MISNLLNYSKTYRKFLGLKLYIIFLLAGLSALSESIGILFLLPILGSVVDTEFSSGSSDSLELVLHALDYIGIPADYLNLSIMIILFFAFKGIFLFFSTSLIGMFSGNFVQSLRILIIQKINNTPLDAFEKDKNSGHYINLLSEQVTKSNVAFNSFCLLFGQIICFIAYTSFNSIINLPLILFTLFVGLVITASLKILVKMVRSIAKLGARQNQILLTRLIEYLKALKYLKATNQLEVVSSRLYHNIGSLRAVQIKTAILAALVNSVREPILIVVLVLAITVNLSVFSAPVDETFISMILLYRSVNSVLRIQSHWQKFNESVVSYDIINNYLDNSDEYVASTDGRISSLSINQEKNIVRMVDIGYTYANERTPIIRNLTLDIQRSKIIGIEGASGVGKSTLLDLILGLRNPTHGRIYIKENLRVGFLPQDPKIFEASVIENITMSFGDSFDPKTKDSVVKILRQLNLYDVVFSMKNGIDTNLGEDGLLLSGGQKQRIALAREIFKEPDLLILDEPTSALDSKNEDRLLRLLKEYETHTAIVFVTHSTANLKICDVVLTMKKNHVYISNVDN